MREDQEADGLIERKEERGWWAFSQQGERSRFLKGSWKRNI